MAARDEAAAARRELLAVKAEMDALLKVSWRLLGLHTVHACVRDLRAT